MNNASQGNTRPTLQAPFTTPDRPWIRTTYQLACEIPTADDRSEETCREAFNTILGWANRVIPLPMPQAAHDGDSFRRDLAGQNIEVVAIPELDLWSFRMEHPDAPYGDRPAVAGRTWTTDITLTRSAHRILLGMRVFCASLSYCMTEVALSRPGVVMELSRRVGLTDGRVISREPWTIDTEDDLVELDAYLRDRRRQLPVVVLSQPDRRRLGVEVSDYVLDSNQLAWRLFGFAHVVKLPWELGFKWTELVGKPWSVFLGAVRTYMPGLDFSNDPVSLHPYTSAERIVFWRQPDDDRMGEEPFTDFLVERLSIHAATRRVNWENRLFVLEARTRQTELARSRGGDVDDWRSLFEDEIGALKSKVAELEKESEEYNDDAIKASSERDYFKHENRQLRFQLDSLRHALQERQAGRTPNQVTIPDDYESLPDWVSDHLTGRLVLHPRALRGIKDARYEDSQLVYRSLLLLAEQYRDTQLGREGSKEAFENGLQELGLRFDPSISETRAGEQGDEYFVRYPPSSGPKRFLKWHLRRGQSKDERICLGIYFFWDDDTNQVIVGWLPSHLDNRLT